MGYSTDYTGSVTVTPPLNPHEITYLREFSESRRVNRPEGPYVVDGRDINARDERQCPEQPSVWCDWVATHDGAGIEWDGVEKFYNGDLWMTYLIDTFLKPGATVQRELADPVPGRKYPDAFQHFTFDHQVSGVIEAQGDQPDDRWDLVVQDNTVSVKRYDVTARGVR